VHVAQKQGDSTKKWPHLWGQVQEATKWWVSGKALIVTVLPAGTAWELTRRIEESEGHTA
jgi:hypothetical protein